MITPIVKAITPIVCFFIISCGNKDNTTAEEKINLSDEPQAAPVEKKEEPKGAAKIYYDNCKVCHGIDGKRQLAGAKDLSVSIISIEERFRQISEGKNKMPGYKNILSEEHIREVVKYLEELRK